MNNSNKNTALSRIMLVGSMTIFGTIGLLVRYVPLSSGELALYRAVMAVLLISAYLLIRRQKPNIPKIKKALPLLILSGAAMGFNWIFLFESYKHTSVSVATVSYYFAPVLVTVISPILFKEKMTLRSWLCFAISTVGIAMITLTGDLTAGSNHLIGVGFGLAAACLYATVILLNKYTGELDGIERTLIQFIAAAVVMLPYVMLTSGFNLSHLLLPELSALLVLGVVHTGITYCMYFSSLSSLAGREVAILSYVDPLVAVLCSSFILKEELTLPQIIGAALVLGFTLIGELELPKSKKNAPDTPDVKEASE